MLPPQIYKSFAALHQSTLNTQEELHHLRRSTERLPSLYLKKNFKKASRFVQDLESFLSNLNHFTHKPYNNLSQPKFIALPIKNTSSTIRSCFSYSNIAFSFKFKSVQSIPSKPSQKGLHQYIILIFLIMDVGLLAYQNNSVEDKSRSELLILLFLPTNDTNILTTISLRLKITSKILSTLELDILS